VHTFTTKNIVKLISAAFNVQLHKLRLDKVICFFSAGAGQHDSLFFNKLNNLILLFFVSAVRLDLFIVSLA
jgi:hypothetical protein